MKFTELLKNIGKAVSTEVKSYKYTKAQEYINKCTEAPQPKKEEKA